MSKTYESEDKMINPSHYKSSNGIECIDAIKAATENLNGYEGYLVGNAIKYLWRYRKKNNAVQDTEKAIWYATKLFNELKNGNEKTVEEKSQTVQHILTLIDNNMVKTESVG